MTRFTPGMLTASQADALNELVRQVRAFAGMTVTAPLTKTQAAGCVNLSVASTAPEDEFDAAIYGAPGVGPGGYGSGPAAQYLYSWRRVENRNDLGVVWSGLPQYVAPNELPAPGVYTENTGYHNLAAVHFADEAAGGAVNSFGPPHPVQNILYPGRIVRVRKTAATRAQLIAGDTAAPLYETDGVDQAVYQLTVLMQNGSLPAGVASVTLLIKADNLQIQGPGATLVQPASGPPGQG